MSDAQPSASPVGVASNSSEAHKEQCSPLPLTIHSADEGSSHPSSTPDSHTHYASLDAHFTPLVSCGALCAVWSAAVARGCAALLRLLRDGDGCSAWSFSQSSRGVDIYRTTEHVTRVTQTQHGQPSPSTSSPPASFCPAFLGVGVLDCSPLVVLDFLSHTERKVEYDEVYTTHHTPHP